MTSDEIKKFEKRVCKIYYNSYYPSIGGYSAGSVVGYIAAIDDHLIQVLVDHRHNLITHNLYLETLVDIKYVDKPTEMLFKVEYNL